MVGADQASVENAFGGWCVEKRDETIDHLSTGEKWNFARFFFREDHRTTQATSHALGHGSWIILIHTTSSALSPTLMRPCPERRGDVLYWVFSISAKANRGWWT